jgi:hypothetical protein
VFLAQHYVVNGQWTSRDTTAQAGAIDVGVVGVDTCKQMLVGAFYYWSPSPIEAWRVHRQLAATSDPCCLIEHLPNSPQWTRAPDDSPSPRTHTMTLLQPRIRYI